MCTQLKSVLLFLSASLFLQSDIDAQVASGINEPKAYYTAEEFTPAAAGQPFSDIRYVEALGSAYFDLQWEKGTIITKQGEAYKDVPIRIDLMAHKLHFRNEVGQEMVIGTAVREVKYEAGGKFFHFINGEMLSGKHSGWYHLMVNGKVSLLKSFRKTFEERMSFGKTELSIKTLETYFVLYNGKEIRVKKPADLVNLVPAQKTAMEQELKNTKSKSKEDQMVSLATYLNTLLTE